VIVFGIATRPVHGAIETQEVRDAGTGYAGGKDVRAGGQEDSLIPAPRVADVSDARRVD
jgi:hypothetical protein